MNNISRCSQSIINKIQFDVFKFYGTGLRLILNLKINHNINIIPYVLIYIKK